jgi:hypothetical protein
VIARLFELSIAIGKVVLLPDGRAPAQGLSLRRLDLDDVGAGLFHQQRRIRPLKDLAEIKDDNAGERQVGMVGHAEPLISLRQQSVTEHSGRSLDRRKHLPRRSAPCCRQPRLRSSRP